MVETLVEPLQVASLHIDLERPVDPVALLDEEAFDRDEFMPYWAELWPSGMALAEHVLGNDLAGASVLELGCGLGLPSLVAALSGARVTAADWACDALTLLRANAVRNQAQVEPLHVDWRLPDALEDRCFDIVLAADVLYEERNGAPLLALLPRVVADGGLALIADPGRRHAAGVLDAAAGKGWVVSTVPSGRLPRGGIHELLRG